MEVVIIKLIYIMLILLTKMIMMKIARMPHRLEA